MLNDNVVDQELAQPAWRRKHRTEEQAREEAFQAYLEASADYFTDLEANGDEPWHKGDIDARRELFMRRYRNN